MTDSEETIALDLPLQHLEAPGFCAADVKLLAQWANDLPRGNLGETTRQLFMALQELNSCRLDAKLRFELLEVLRPLVYSVCGSLEIHYHSQPIVLPAHAFQVYLLSQTMQMQLATGYQIVAGEACSRKSLLPGKTKNRALMAQALHRAISDLGSTLFRGSLIYSEADPAVWRQLHSLYHFACSRDVVAQSFKDLETGQVYPISVEQSYIKALLLGSVRSNQLRQEDLKLVFDSLGTWVQLAELATYEAAGEDHIVVNLDSEEPPVFQALFSEPEDNSRCRMLSLDTLLHHLGEMLVGDVLVDKNPTALSTDLIKHLLISWGSYTRRTFMRMDTRDSLLVCVGMSNLHYFSADEVEFEDFIRGTIHHTFQDDSENNPFLKQQDTLKHEQRDIWDSPLIPEVHGTELALESIDNHIRQFESSNPISSKHRSYDNYRIEMVNVSPGGYALQWPQEITTKLSNGDIVGICESQHANWSVGIVSWIRRNDKEITQLGVKLLAPSAIPFAGRPINSEKVNGGKAAANDNGDDFRPVLLLPEIKLIGQTATLLTPQLSFREKQTLLLVQQGRTITVRLKKLISTTGAINQFDIDVLDKPWQEKYQPGSSGNRFDKLWSSL
jgi:hypothetical protein